MELEINVTPTSKEYGAWTGRVQALQLVRGSCSLQRAVALSELKESRLYEQAGLTWEQACEECGISRAQADREITSLEELGEAYHRLSDLARISPNFYRQIAGKVDSSENTIELNGEKISIIPENTAAIRAGIKALRAQALANRPYYPGLVGDIDCRFEILIKDCHKFLRSVAGPETAKLLLEALEEAAVKLKQAIRACEDFSDPSLESKD